jgi:peptidoglycan biosynthesis protein MviN/MurJ (putative lipid II flippase)
VPGSEMLILPLVFSLGMIFNSIFLVKIFQKDFGSVWEYIRKTFFQISSASLLMGAITYLSLNIFDKIFNTRTFIGIFLQGFVSGILGMGILYVVLLAMKNRELKEIVNSLKQKFWKTPTIAPEPEELP